jgi:hypothetical protein
MTQADSAPALRRSLDSEPAGAGQTTPHEIRQALCVFGNEITDQPVLVGVTEQNSGPGWSHYACPEHASWYATTLDAPEWLRTQYAPKEVDPVKAAYAAYVLHVAPNESSGRSMCLACTGADQPRDGCADGVALWDEYRRVRISKPKQP